MSTEILVIGFFCFFVVALFVVGMFLYPELFGISKKQDENLKEKE